MAKVSLQVNGLAYGGWKAVRVTRGIECISGSADLQVSDRWAGQRKPWPIYEEDECKVLIDDEILITGFVDRRSVSYSADDHSLGVSARDRTSELVDCSAVLDKWEFRNTDLLKFAKKLCEPYGIEVTLNGTAQKIVRLCIDPGDSVFEALERACRMTGYLAMSDGQGGLVLTRPGSSKVTTALIEGKNILAASGDFDATNRFRTYLVLGQHRGTDEDTAESAAHISAFAEDENVRRVERTLVIRPEGSLTTEQAKQRAQWEATVRAARGDLVVVTVQGWTMGNGEVWPINALVHLKSPFLAIDGEMLISQATYTLDDGGTTTQLTLVRPDAFNPQPLITRAKTAQFMDLAGGV